MIGNTMYEAFNDQDLVVYLSNGLDHLYIGDIERAHITGKSLVIIKNGIRVGTHWTMPTNAFRAATKEEFIAWRSGARNINDIAKNEVTTVNNNYPIY